MVGPSRPAGRTSSERPPSSNARARAAMFSDAEAELLEHVGPGAEAPKRSRPSTSPPLPTHFHQPCSRPARPPGGRRPRGAARRRGTPAAGLRRARRRASRRRASACPRRPARGAASSVGATSVPVAIRISWSGCSPAPASRESHSTYPPRSSSAAGASSPARSSTGAPWRESSSATGPSGAFQRDPPGLDGLVGVGRADHPEVGDRAQRRVVLDRLVRRAVLAEADGVVRPDPHAPAAPSAPRGAPTGACSRRRSGTSSRRA